MRFDLCQISKLSCPFLPRTIRNAARDTRSTCWTWYAHCCLLSVSVRDSSRRSEEIVKQSRIAPPNVLSLSFLSLALVRVFLVIIILLKVEHLLQHSHLDAVRTMATEGQAVRQTGEAEEDSHFYAGERRLHLVNHDNAMVKMQTKRWTLYVCDGVRFMFINWVVISIVVTVVAVVLFLLLV